MRTLILDDEEPIVHMLALVCEKQGHTVLPFTDSTDALIQLASQPIDLLITDVVMPGMNGRVLAERLRQQWPDLQVLFTSGYTEQIIAQHGLLDSGIDFLAKPYSIRALAERVRGLLDRTP